MRALQNAGVLAIAALHVACGQGIALDPESRRGDAFVSSPRDGEASDASVVEDTSFDAADFDGTAKDAGRAEGAPPDAANSDAPNLDGPADIPTDRRDGGSSDVDDASTDASVVDVATDVQEDRSLDVSADPISADRSESGPDASDEPTSGDASHDQAAEADTAVPPDGCTTGCGADYFVDALAPPGGDGSAAKPFTTITQAIEAYRAAAPGPKTARVAPGLYDEALGERFPLVLRGLSLEGAGRDQTVVMGSGFVDHAVEGGGMSGRYMVTMVAGDAQLPTRISKMSLLSATAVPVRNYLGVLCDRGSATGEVPAPAGQTRLDQLALGPGYDTSVAASSSTTPSSTGCNLVLTASTMTAGWKGLHAVGCDAMGPAVPVIVEMGSDDPLSGNTVSFMEMSDDSACGALFEDCVARASLQYNAFVDSMYGVAIDPWRENPGVVARPRFVIKHNSFERLSAAGLMVLGTPLVPGTLPMVDELSDNRFARISRAEGSVEGPSAEAIYIDLFSLGKARRNQFIGNDIGIWLAVWEGPGTAADFGTASDPGNNVFRCNFSVYGDGADVLIERVIGTWQGTIPFAGNAWDHAPPTVQRDDITNGVDVVLLGAPGVLVNRNNASRSTLECPSGRAPGP